MSYMPGAGLAVPLKHAGAPVSAVNEVQTFEITGTPTGGTFSLTFRGQTTASIAYNASAATVKTRLAALSTIGGTANLTTSGGALPGTAVLVTFQGDLAGQDVDLITATSGLTGGTDPAITVTETTKGVPGTFAGITPHGALLNDTTNALLYQNSGTQVAPVWGKVGSE